MHRKNVSISRQTKSLLVATTMQGTVKPEAVVRKRRQETIPHRANSEAPTDELNRLPAHKGQPWDMHQWIEATNCTPYRALNPTLPLHMDSKHRCYT